MMKRSSTNCAVAIVGRPNVGKSSIFNRLAGRRIAIVHEWRATRHEERGVTRDRLIQEVQWNNRRFELIDTGGLGKLDPVSVAQASLVDEIEIGVRRQAEVAVQDAVSLIFVTDVETGILPQDEAVADFLRKSGKSIFLAANKADNPAREGMALDFERLGFPVFPVSALHNRGFEPLMQAVIQTLPDIENTTLNTPLKATIVGRPNVGKSSLINRLLRSDRVIVAKVPGTTRDSIDIPFVIGADAMARHYILTDTAGIRRIGKIHNAIDGLSLDRTERSIARADVVVLVLDAIHGLTAQDKTIASMILNYRKGCVMVVTKWDLIKGVPEQQYRTALRERVPFLDFVPAVFVSSLTGFNIRRMVETIDHVASQVYVTLPTGLLNRVMMEACRKVQPPLVQGKRLKIYYATQVQSPPVTVALFVNHPDRCVPAYERYLIRSLRFTFGLEGMPVVFQLRARRSPIKR